MQAERAPIGGRKLDISKALQILEKAKAIRGDKRDDGAYHSAFQAVAESDVPKDEKVDYLGEVLDMLRADEAQERSWQWQQEHKDGQ